jgi:UDP-glucose:(heptosyl)LPS alpha-1,3-glucosyltransferase
MKKIYIIRASNDRFGGAENYLLRLSSQFTKNNINYQIIKSHLPRFLPSWLRVLLFNLQVCLFKGDKFYFSLDRISCPDIYRAGDGVHKVFLSIEKKSTLNLLHPVYLLLEKKCFNNSKKIIVNSKMVKKEIQRIYGVSEKKISVIYNGINFQNLDLSDSFRKISKEFDINKSESILLFVGSGFKRKGVTEFLKIISKLRDKNFKAFIIGKENNINHYKKLSRELLIEKKVIFTGPREDVNHFYNISDIFIFPTHYEPFGNVVLEAMSFGNAVFTTNRAGASEIINPDYVMSSPNDYSVVKKIGDLLDNSSRLTEIKVDNIEASKKYSIDRNVSETLKVINEVIN